MVRRYHLASRLHLGRDPSTIYRDIKRNQYTDDELPELNGYHALVSQDRYEQRRATHRKMIAHPELKASIEDRLKAGWSPEQIAGRMRLERHPIQGSQGRSRRTVLQASARASPPPSAAWLSSLSTPHILDSQSPTHRPERINERGVRPLGMRSHDVL